MQEATRSKEKVWFGIPLGGLTLSLRDLSDGILEVEKLNRKKKIYSIDYLVRPADGVTGGTALLRV